MTVFPVKHSALLRQPEFLLPRPQLVQLIEKLTDNLVAITDESGEFLLRLDDGRVIDTKGWAGWEWTHGIGLYGMYHYYQQTGDEKTLAIIDDWFRQRLAEGTPTKNVNTVCPLLTLAYRYEETRNPALLPVLERWAEWVMYEMPRTEQGGLQHIVYNNENHQQLWDDTLMMSVLPLAKIGKLLNRPEYVEEASYQFLLHVQYLMDRETGLWFHGWNFDGRHNFARARWARGNSWLTIVIPEFIELMGWPEQHATRRFLQQVLESQVAALRQWQHESGLWHTLLDDRDSYLEASATAGFAYGILKAVRKRYLSRDYLPMAELAVKGVVNHINEDGELTQVSFGTAMGSDLDYYRQIPLTSMPYGQAMALLCLTEYLRVYL
ncbi:MAG: glycoside hydrolase family 88 protein [Mixta calida]|uniref:beta-galactosidase BglB n=1 Tax=Mixta TaxID=2100764 RepID=UPI0005363C43|nr:MULTISPECIES: glycoside hydrolase family 88 protein [Mixta]AIX74114.1 glycosyl hydrolase family 88 [Pantoea sp. PSNIH2]MDU3815064.1 glycoside hydrolase family 88 protein [Pantoea sp.]POU51509.1 glycoside hydrolase 105 family protein [Pantoea sp. PSNIH5]POU62918.1 glycoside hydrolase 105 family protein [Pantoea sp. PSNIH4]POY69526.1 glycoside hydrolase 105 family protein [Pantoea sp. PSNIH3]HCW46587.1 glycoside hydrolase 105 family protein [Erwiniaceae bacterium]